MKMTLQNCQLGQRTKKDFQKMLYYELDRKIVSYPTNNNTFMTMLTIKQQKYG